MHPPHQKNMGLVGISKIQNNLVKLLQFQLVYFKRSKMSFAMDLGSKLF